MPSIKLFRLSLVLGCALSVAAPARAQDAISDFFSSIFGGRPRPAPSQPVRPRPPRPHMRQPEAHIQRPARPEGDWRKPQTPQTPETPPQQAGAPSEPAAPSFIVLVIGDTEAGRLAGGLKEAFAGDPRIAVIDKTKEDSGLVREDFYDWRKEAKALLDGPQHFDLAVMQIGINDKQKLRPDATTAIEPLTKPFNEIYAKRVEEIAGAFRDRNVPLVWVGLPIMRSDSLSAAALNFNDIDRQYAGAAGARFVDLWEAFSDVNSVYKASGPDVNGDIVRLRAADGVHFNAAGARKAAHFVEPEVRRALEARLRETPAETPPPQIGSPGTTLVVPGATPVVPEAALAPATTVIVPPPAPESAAPAPEKALAGKVTPLNDPALSPGGALASLPGPEAPRPAETPAPQPGRADDFSLPRN